MSEMMNDLSAPLSGEEMDWLEDFLLGRFDETADYRDMDEGVLGVSELDGYFTALVSGPVMLQPSVWLPALWGDVEPQWQNDEQFFQVLGLMIRHMNGIVDTLMQQPENFEPIFDERHFEGKVTLIVDEWCDGYWRGISLAERDWELGSEPILTLLKPISAFTEQASWFGHNLELHAMQALQQQVAVSARQLHAFWLERRSNQPPSAPLTHNGPRPGRNDPCPCGSGKKYKKCCLN